MKNKKNKKIKKPKVKDCICMMHYGRYECCGKEFHNGILPRKCKITNEIMK